MSDDSGFTLVELLTAIAVFSVLMVIVGRGTLTGFSAIRDIGDKSNAQADAQNAAEWLTRQLRYVETPEGQASAITEASPNAISFYTYSGSGPKHDVPYLVKVFVTTTKGDEGVAPCLVVTPPATGAKWKNLCSSVSTPTRVTGGWSWPAPVTRQLLRVPAANGAPVKFSVWASQPAASPKPTPTSVTPTTLGPLPLVADVDVPEYVVFQIGDQTLPRSLVSQQVRLENLE
jgi:prepilin-type N-terminal cleavage/methylation domain-containing protein